MIIFDSPADYIICSDDEYDGATLEVMGYYPDDEEFVGAVWVEGPRLLDSDLCFHVSEVKPKSDEAIAFYSTLMEGMCDERRSGNSTLSAPWHGPR